MIEKDYLGKAIREFFKDAGVEIGMIEYQTDEVKISFIDGNITLLNLSDFKSHFGLHLESYCWDNDRITNCLFVSNY